MSQQQGSEERVIAYGSKMFNPAQKCSCIMYRELLNLVHFVRHYKHFLLGRLFLARIDHGSLRWLLNFKEQTGIVGRWMAQLSPYQMKIEHRPGRNHVNADGLFHRTAALKR